MYSCNFCRDRESCNHFQNNKLNYDHISVDPKFLQCKRQLQSMANVKEVKSKHSTMKVLVNERNVNLNVIKMKDNGDCLFAALLHQLNCAPTKSKNFETDVKKFRANIATYVKNNIGIFEASVKNTLHEKLLSDSYDSNSSDEDGDKEITQEMILDYVDNGLPKSAYGGLETIQAVALMHEVNIFSAMEGTFSFSFHGIFNEKYQRSLCIAYRKTIYSKRKDWNHYDSIVGIDEMDLKEIIAGLNKNKS